MKVENNTRSIPLISDTKTNQTIDKPAYTKQAQTRSWHLSPETLSMLMLLVLAVLILPTIGLLPSAANGIRMQHLIHTR